MADNNEAIAHTLHQKIGGMCKHLSQLRRAGVYAELTVMPEVIKLSTKKNGAKTPTKFVIKLDDEVVDLDPMDTRLGVQQMAIKVLENSVDIAPMLDGGELQANSMAYIDPHVTLNGDVYAWQ